MNLNVTKLNIFSIELSNHRKTSSTDFQKNLSDSYSNKLNHTYYIHYFIAFYIQQKTNHTSAGPIDWWSGIWSANNCFNSEQNINRVWILTEMFHEQVNKNLPKYFGNLWTIFILILESPFELIGGTMDRTSPSSDTGSPSTWSISVLSGPPFDFVSVFNVNPKKTCICFGIIPI